MATKKATNDDYSTGSEVAFSEAAQKVRELATIHFLKHEDYTAGVLRDLIAHFEEQAKLCAPDDEKEPVEARKRRAAGELFYWLKELYDYCPLSKADEREADYKKKIGALLEGIQGPKV